MLPAGVYADAGWKATDLRKTSVNWLLKVRFSYSLYKQIPAITTYTDWAAGNALLGSIA
jgi:hypothetical protein